MTDVCTLKPGNTFNLGRRNRSSVRTTQMLGYLVILQDRDDVQESGYSAFRQLEEAPVESTQDREDSST